MIYTAQRVLPVLEAASGAAINVYSYTQSPALDNASPLDRLEAPRALAHRIERVPPPGNRVMSYIDITTPSDVISEEIVEAIEQLLRAETLPSSPFCPEGSRIAFAFGISAELRPEQRWREELTTLLKRALERDE